MAIISKSTKMFSLHSLSRAAVVVLPERGALALLLALLPNLAPRRRPPPPLGALGRLGPLPALVVLPEGGVLALLLALLPSRSA